MRRTEPERVHGVLLLDKSPDMSSNLALQKAKRLFGSRKAGHTGSLDPIASGLLPCCFGEATKFSGYLLNSDKRYLARVRLGITTTTADCEGEVLEERPVPVLADPDLERVLGQFRGDILQVPPMYSALKHQGQRLYDLARRGIDVERPARSVTIHALRLEYRDGENLELDVHCSKGTYIRSLAEDIGRELGCGAHVAALRRTAVGELDLAKAPTLADLESLTETERLALLMPMDSMVSHFPEVRLTEPMAHGVRQGQAVSVAPAPARGWVRMYGPPARFLGLGEVLEDGRLAPRRLVQTADPRSTEPP